MEAVYDANGNLITDPIDYGSYNYSSPETAQGAVLHLIFDMLPYILLANSPDDPTPLPERIVPGGLEMTANAVESAWDYIIEQILEHSSIDHNWGMY